MNNLRPMCEQITKFCHNSLTLLGSDCYNVCKLKESSCGSFITGRETGGTCIHRKNERGKRK